MMKKLLVLMLVLGLTTAANATLSLSVNGDTSVTEYSMLTGTTVVIDVYSDQANFAYECYVGITNGAGGMSELGEWTGNNKVYAAAGQGTITRYDHWWWDDVCITSNPDTFPISAGRHFDMEFQCTTLGDVTISLTDIAGTPVDSVLIHQVIPEPVSMVLLGLGGLLLRRRR